MSAARRRKRPSDLVVPNFIGRLIRRFVRDGPRPGFRGFDRPIRDDRLPVGLHPFAILRAEGPKAGARASAFSRSLTEFDRIGRTRKDHIQAPDDPRALAREFGTRTRMSVE